MGQLTNQYVSQSYQGLLKMTDSTTGVTATLQTVQTGDGTDTPLQISKTQVNISGSLTVNGAPVSFNTGSLVTTASFNAYTSSNDSKVNSLIAATGSYATTSSLTSLSSSIATTDLNQNNVIAGLATTSSVNTKLDTGSFNSYTSSNDSKVNSLIAATGSYATTSSLTSLSSSIATTDLSQNNRLTSIEGITGSLATTSSLTSLSQSIAVTDLGQNNTIAGLATTSSLTSLSSSIATTDLNQNNVIAGLATTSSLTSLSSSIATTDLNQNNTIAGLATTSSLTSLSSSIATTDLGQNNRLGSLESKTGSYATTSSVNALTGSINSLNAATSSFVTETESGSFLITGSANGNTLTFTKGNGATFNLQVDTGSNSNRNGLITTGSVGGSQSITGSLTITGSINITGSLRSTDIIGTGSLFLQPNQTDARYLEVYNTSPTDTHITASGGQIFLGDDQTYVKVDNYGSVERIDVVAGNELVVSSSIINLTGSLHQSGTFYPDVIDWTDSSIVQSTGSYILTTNISGVTEYDSYQNIASALQQYINTGSIPSGTVSGSAQIVELGFATTSSLNSYTTTSSFNSYTSSNDGRVSSLENKTGSYATTGSNIFNGTQTITGSVDITGTVTAASASFIYLTTVYQTSSVIFSSGSNILGDASNDTQTLWGTVKIPTGPVSITGSVEISGSIRQNIPYSGTGTNTAVTNSFIGNTQITGSGNGVNALKVSGSISATNKITAGISRSGSANNGNMLVQGLHAYFEALSISESIMLVESFDDAGTYDITFRVDANPTGVYFKDYDNGTAQAYTSWMTMGPNVNSNPSPQFLRSVGITGSLGVTGGITGSLQGTSSYATQALSASYAPSNPLPSGLVSGSSQIIYSGLTGIPSGIISGSAQLPSGLVSSSAQVAEYGYATTGSNTFIGNEIISGSLTVTGSIKQTIPFIGTGTNAAVTNSFIGNTYITGSGTGGNALKVSGSGTFTRKVTVGDSSALRQSQFGQLDVAGLNPYLGVFGSGSSKLVTEVYDDASTYDVALNQYSTPSGSGFADWDQSVFTYVPFMTLGTNVGTNPAPQFKRNVGITGSLTVSGSIIITGSVQGNVNALSIASNTASLNLNNGNFFTLQLVSGSNTFINPSNIKAGQTVNILLSTTGSGTVTFPTSVLQVSGSSYTPTTTTGKDIITLVSFDSTNLYLANVKNLV